MCGKASVTELGLWAPSLPRWAPAFESLHCRVKGWSEAVFPVKVGYLSWSKTRAAVTELGLCNYVAFFALKFMKISLTKTIFWKTKETNSKKTLWCILPLVRLYVDQGSKGALVQSTSRSQQCYQLLLLLSDSHTPRFFFSFRGDQVRPLKLLDWCSKAKSLQLTFILYCCIT